MKRLFVILLLLCLKECLYSQNLNSNYIDNSCAIIEMLNIEKYPEIKERKFEIFFYFLLWQKSYNFIYLEYPTDVTQAFAFKEFENDKDYIADSWKEWMWNNHTSFQFKTTDTSLRVFYKDDEFAEYQSCIFCNDFTNTYFYSLRMYDTENYFIEHDSLIYKEFLKEMGNIAYSCHKKWGYSLIFPSDVKSDINFERTHLPVFALFQYEMNKGLTIHKLCSKYFKMQYDEYTKALEIYAKQFCEKYNCNKIIFSTKLMYKK